MFMITLLITHIAIALISIGQASWLVISPNTHGFKYAYALITGTLVSGVSLVALSKADLVKSCWTGIGYLALVSFGLVVANWRLARQSASNDDSI